MSPKKTVKQKRGKRKSEKTIQKGGERHMSMIRKEGDKISFPSGFPVLETNGDYHIIHSEDAQSNKERIQLGKLNVLNMWVDMTFDDDTDVLIAEALSDENSTDPIILARRLFYNNDTNMDFRALVFWLNEFLEEDKRF